MARVTAAVLVGAVLLGGCSATPGVAARVDSWTVSQSRVDAAHRDLSLVVADLDPADVLGALVVAPYYIRAAERHGVGVSAEEAQSLIRANAAAVGVEGDTTFGESGIQIIRFTMSVQKLGSLPDGPELIAGVEQQVAELDVEINPRYGRYDEEIHRIVAATSPWIVEPAETSLSQPS